LATSSHTTSITAPGITGGLVTSVSVTNSGDDVLDCNHLGLADGAANLNYAAPFTGTKEVSVSYIGDSYPESGDTGALSLTGAITASFSNCVCVSASVSGSTGELITAEVTYREIEAAS